MKTSLKDVAKACNVSTTTVSLVLNDRPNRISEGTKSLIKKTALEMNYRPNLLSRSLVTKQLGIIGLIVPSIRVFSYADYCHEIINIMENQRFTVLLGITNSDPLLEKEALLRFLDYGVDGLIISRSYNFNKYNDQDTIDILSRTKTPFILTGPFEMETPYPYVSIDYEYSGYLAAMHLIQLGHKKISFIHDDEDIILNHLRINGYKNALLESDLAYNDDLIIDSSYELDTSLLDLVLSKGATALVSANEKSILSLYQRAREIDIKVPDDFSIVSFTNSYAHEVMNPSLTSIVPPNKVIAQDISSKLINLINGPSTFKSPHFYRSEIILRNSTALSPIIQDL